MANATAFLEARDFLRAHATDYDAAVAGFRWPALTRFNWALDYFDPMARGNARTALMISHEDGRLESRTFDDLARRSDAVAAWLRGLGAKRGDRLLLMLPNVVALWEVMLACTKLGVVMIPTSTLLVGEDLEDRLARGGVRWVVAGAESTAKLRPLLGDRIGIAVDGAVPDGWVDYAGVADGAAFTPDGETPADDPLLLYFTSGTTARPKLVQHTHASYPVGHLSTMYWIGLRPSDVHLNISSAGWAKHAWSCVFGPWNAGATVLVTNHARFDAKRVLKLLGEASVTTLCAPPTVWRMLILEDLQGVEHALREVVSAGEPLNPEVIERVEEAWGLMIREGYGQTETTCQMGVSPGQTVHMGSMGRPLPGYPVVLLDPDGNEADEGEMAIRLHPRPLPVMAGYAGDPERTEATLGGTHYRTGDVATRDDEGYFWYVGRADDVFKSSDYRISPFELESALLEHPAVIEAAVVPSPDAVRMNVPKAIVTLAADLVPDALTARAIMAFARERLAPYKRIRILEFAPLPKTLSGKIRRVELRQAEVARRAAGEQGPHEYFESDFPDLKA